MKYFLILSVLFTIILPFIGKLDGSNRLNIAFEIFNMRFCTGYVMYYVLGYYLSQISWSKNNEYVIFKRIRSFLLSFTLSRKKASIIAVFLFVNSFLAAFIISNIISVSNGEATQSVYEEFAPLGFIINISFLMLFRIHITLEKRKNRISIIESCGAGIYLMHPLLLSIAFRFSGISRLLGGVIVYLIAFLICMIIKMLGQFFRKKD